MHMVTHRTGWPFLSHMFSLKCFKEIHKYETEAVDKLHFMSTDRLPAYSVEKIDLLEYH